MSGALVRASSSISGEKSVPTTLPVSPTARRKAMARSPVPVAQSSTASPDCTPDRRTARRRLFVGWGPFEQLPFRRPGRPAFYITDFFLSDPHPWRHPAQWEEISAEEFAQRFPAAPTPRIEWQPLSIDEFAPLFDSAKA